MLRRAVDAAPQDPSAVLMLGLTAEDLGRFAEAKTLYLRYFDLEPSGALQAQVRERLPWLDRQELAAGVRDALAREAELAQTPPDPRHVAVFPFVYLGSDPELRPLGRALAEMLVTDLSQTDRLTVLERLQVQMLLDELRLAEQGAVDSTTAARSGRLLGAGRIVQGHVDGTEAELRMRAAVTGVGSGAQGGTVVETDALQRLLDLQKRVALGLYRTLGVELTPAERERVERRPTENIRALLAYGLALEAGDAGDFARAARHFREAAALDPSFSVARERAAQAAGMEAARRTGTAEIARRVVRPDVDFDALQGIPAALVGIEMRDPAAEGLGLEGMGRSTLDIHLRIP